MTRKLPGGLDTNVFMRRHWQRKPLLVRGAFARFADPLSVREVLALATSPEAISRLVRRCGSSWTLEHGPFSASRLKQLPRRDWTILIQDTQHFSAPARRLLSQFDFIPHARVDDLMVSYARPGGSVGPHLDSYDVFLLQGHGRRRWRISRQRDHRFVPGLPLKILERFVPEEEWVLEAGDMLYLPPGVAHHGIAESECLTWSIGFRAPANRELIGAFLDFLHERIEATGEYRDPGAVPARHPGELPAGLLAHASKAMQAIRWTPSQLRDFAGRYFSEPKAHVFFDPPPRGHSRGRFIALALERGIMLDRRSILLFSGSMFFMNGEAVRATGPARRWLRRLADRRHLPAPRGADAPFWDVAYAWYVQGFLHPQSEEDRS